MKLIKVLTASILVIIICMSVFSSSASTPHILNYEVYRDAGAPNLTTTQAEAAVSSAIGNFSKQFPKLHFVRSASGTSTALNPKAGCKGGRNVICIESSSPSLDCGRNNACETVHHKSSTHMLNQRITSISSRYVFRVVEQSLCTRDPNNSNTHRLTTGAANQNGRDVVASHPNNTVGTLVHEISHLFGGRDSYGSSLSCTPVGAQCIMNNIAHSTKWCTSCASKISLYISTNYP